MRGLEHRGLFNGDTDRDDVVARLPVLAAGHRGQPRLILNTARRGAATAALCRRLLQELQEP